MIEREPTPLDYRSPQPAPTRGVFNEPACYAGVPEPTDPGETQLPQRRRPGSWWIFRLAMLGILIIVLVTVLALFLPMISLIQSVSGK